MATRDDLQRIMDAPGFGTGRAFRDQKAQEAEALALLPDPASVMPVRASTNMGAGWLVCSFGNEDGQDWYLITDEVRGSIVAEFSDYPADAKMDALRTAAIVNAYRMGLLVRRDAARSEALEEAAAVCEAEADLCDDAAKWSSQRRRYAQDCKAAAYAMRDRAKAIRALASQPAGGSAT